MTSILRFALEKSIYHFISPSLPPEERAQVIDQDTQSDDLSSTPIIGFKPQYAIPIRKPKDDLQAQKLYNAIRTVAFYLDAIPVLGAKLPFGVGVGVDSILGLIPFVGDSVGLILGLYQVFLCTLFGLPLELIGWMILNVILDCAIGLLPVVGDLLDVAFKSNLRNLTLLESHLLEKKGECKYGSYSILIPPSDQFIPKQASRSGSSGRWWWSREATIPANPNSFQPHKGRRTRPLSRSSQKSTDQTVPTFTSSRATPSSRIDNSGFDGVRFTELEPGEEATSRGGLRSREKKDFRKGESDSHSSSLQSTLRMTLPKGFEPVSEMSRDGLLISSPPIPSSVSASTPSLLPLCPQDRTSQNQTSIHSRDVEMDQEVEPYTINEQINEHSAEDNTDQDNALFSSATQNLSMATPIASSGTASRRGVSWYESAVDSSPSFPRSKSKRTEPPDPEDGLEASQEPRARDSEPRIATEEDTLLDRKFKESGLSGRRSSLRSRNHLSLLDDKVESSRARKIMIIYAAIFCVSYTTSLDSSTSYLYLNFACSEYGSLATFSTVSIVQQLVFALGKPPLAKLSDVSGRFSAFLTSIILYSSGYSLVVFSSSLTSFIFGMCFQSLGFTGIQTLISIIIADTASPRYRGLVLAVVNLPYLINFAFSGMLVDSVMNEDSSGIFESWKGWRLGFGIWIIAVPVSAVPLLFTLYLGQKKARKLGLTCTEYEVDGVVSRRNGFQAARGWLNELDFPGLIFLSIGGGSILLPITLAGRREETKMSSLPLFSLGVISLVLFLIWESTFAQYPVMPFRLLKNRAVVCACLIGLVDFASFSLSWTFLSSFVQVVKGWEQRRTGYFAMTQNVSSTLTGVLAGSIMASTQRFKSLLVMGVVIRLVGVSLMIRFRTAQDTMTQILCQILQGMGGGFIAITMQVAAQTSVAGADVAVVTALELLTTEVGAASGSALAGHFFSNTLSTKLQENLPQLSSEEVTEIYGSLEVALSYPIGTSIRKGIIDSWVSLMHSLCVGATIILIPALILALLIPNHSLSDGSNSHVHGSLRRRSSGYSSIRSSGRGRSRSRSGNSRLEHSGHGRVGSRDLTLFTSFPNSRTSSSRYQSDSHSVSPKSERKPLPDFT